MNGRGSPDAWQCGADGVAEGCVSFVAEGCACGGDAVLRLGDWDEGRRWNAGRLGGTPIVMVLARGMWRSVPTEYREAINAGRMLVVSPFSQGVVRVSKETAEKRNGWILDNCDEAVFASLDPNGSLARLVAARPNLRYQVL